MPFNSDSDKLYSLLPNIMAVAVAYALTIVWGILPIPSETWTVRNIDPIGLTPLLIATLLCIVASVRWRPSVLRNTDVVLITMVGAMILFLSSEILGLPLIINSNGVNLILVFLPSTMFVFMSLRKENFVKTLVGVFCMVGFPILILDVFFWLSLPYISNLPVGSFIIGGLGLQDGLNMVVVSLLFGSLAMTISRKFYL